MPGIPVEAPTELKKNLLSRLGLVND